MDDRTGIERLRDVVAGRADQLHTAPVRGVVRLAAREGREEGVMDVDDAAGVRGQELRPEDLHVAGEHHELHGALTQDRQLTRLLLAPVLWRDRKAEELHVEATR